MEVNPRDVLEEWIAVVLEDYDDIADLKDMDRGADACPLASALLKYPEGRQLADRLVKERDKWK